MPNTLSHRGFSLVSVTVSMFIILAFAASIISYGIMTRKAGFSFTNSTSTAQIADAAMQKVMFCLNATSGTKCGGTYGSTYVGESNVAFGEGTWTASVVGTGSGRTITINVSTTRGKTRQFKADLTTIPPTDDVNFSYALQAGDAGARMENNSTIHGTIYADGDVTCTGITAVIDGDAYSSKVNGKVNSCKVNYHAHADKVLNAKVLGNAYFNVNPTDIAGSTVSGTKFAGATRPAPQALPALNLVFWRTSAAAGGVIYGDYHPADGSSMGPVKIEGNLILDQNVDVTINGPVWVQGDITTLNNSSFNLNASFGAYSTLIIADDPNDNPGHGKIRIVNNTKIRGSGNSKSHILMVSTNTSLVDNNPAMSVANNASGAIFLAPNGVMRLENNAGAKSMAAKRLFLDQNATVTYMESEVADANFSNSPGGTWRLMEGSWREVH